MADLLSLSTSANWNQLEADWRRLLTLEPEGCFGIEDGGRIVASGTVITYSSTLAWIGMILTLPECRGRGFASQLMQRCLDFCAARAITCVKLDATDLGRPLYAKLGFVEEYVVERWRGDLPESPRAEFPFDPAIDRQAFGADRSRLLVLTGPARPGRVASHLGPIVCRTAAEARARVLGAGVSGVALWDIPEPNAAARTLAAELGFTPVRQLWRMRKGPPVAERPDLVFALAGFELG
ncbi:MAG: GNAT family N-acetyltransferase [Candidatus Solibacter usitatus]|nr:GNAT family N-acetyltransferase [Candidatus Solibacter usitatus]